MKKILSFLLTATMAVSFSSVAFASTGNSFASTSATSDEALEMEGIELSKLPDKLKYTLDDCDYYLGDLKLTEDVFEDMSSEELEEFFENLIDEGSININVDYEGANLIAYYNNHMVESVVNNEDCEWSVADPFRFSELKKYEDIDFEDLSDEEFENLVNEISNLIYREYTVDVTYEGFKTSYTITLVEDDDFSEQESKYEFVSYNNPSDRPYIIGEDVYEIFMYDEDDNEIVIETVDVDTTGMTVTLKDKETGELVTFDEDNASFDITFYHFVNDAVPLRAGHYYAIGTVYTDDFESVDFDYVITFAEAGDLTPTTSVDKNSTPDSPDKNGDKSSTSDTPNKANSNNGAIQTGEVTPAIILLVLISGAVVTMYFYRRKLNV
ncbi:MAG: hypothetical protein J1E85_02770 [Ruminococcus sp.]|nr:hypothetical protein [Ruminococcus sp.]